MKPLAGVLIILSALFIIWAYDINMHIDVDPNDKLTENEIVQKNIAKQSQFVNIAGFLFIGAVILFSKGDNKQRQ